MGSAFDDLFAEAASPSLMHLHGRDVTRWPAGEQSAAETVSAMWAPENTGQREAEMPAHRIVIEGTLTLAADQAIDSRDAWLIDGWRYNVQAPGHVIGGLRYVRLRRTDKITTSRPPEIL